MAVGDGRSQGAGIVGMRACLGSLVVVVGLDLEC